MAKLSKLFLLSLLFMFILTLLPSLVFAGVTSIVITAPANASEIFENVNTTYEISFTPISNVSATGINCTIGRNALTNSQLAVNVSVKNNTLTNISVPFVRPLLNRYHIECSDSETFINRTPMQDIYINDAPTILGSSENSGGIRLSRARTITFTAQINDTASSDISTANNDSVGFYVCRENIIDTTVGCRSDKLFCSETAVTDGEGTCTYTVAASDGYGREITAYLFTSDDHLNSTFSTLSFKTAGSAIGSAVSSTISSGQPGTKGLQNAASRIQANIARFQEKFGLIKHGLQNALNNILTKLKLRSSNS